MSFLPCWPIGLITSFLELPRFIYFAFLPFVVPMGLLVVIPTMLLIGVITFFLRLPRPMYFTFTSCCAYGSVGYHSCHVGSLVLLPISISFPFHISLLLDFFCCWAPCQKWASTLVVLCTLHIIYCECLIAYQVVY